MLILPVSSLRRWLTGNSQFLIRWSVIALMLLLSLYWAPRASARQAVLLLGAGISVVFLKWPPLGLAVLIVAGLTVPFTIGTGTQTSLNVAVLLSALLVGLWLLDMVRRKEIRLLPSRPIRPLLAFSLVAIVAFLMGNLPWFLFALPASLQAQVGGLMVFLLSAGAFLLMAHQVDERWLARLTWAFLALGGLYVAGRLALGLGDFTGRLFPAGSTGSVFWVWLMALAFGQAAFNRQLDIGWRILLGCLVAGALYLGLFANRTWASGWLPSLVALAAVLWAGAPRLGWLATLVGGAFALANGPRVVGLVMINEQYSLLTRQNAWLIVAEIIKANPVLGLGPANYYHYTPLFPILGYYLEFNSHNQYVDIVAQTGLLGLACFLWFVWEVGRLGWRLRTQVPEGFARAYVCGALGGLAGMLAAGMLADWVLPFVYNIGLAGFRASVLGWLFLGGLVGLEQMVRCRPEQRMD